MKKIAVIFPGIGYTADRPLLHYSKKHLKSMGYEIVSVKYDIELKGKVDKIKTLELTDKLYAASESALKSTDFNSSDVVFVSKSVGTLISAMYAERYGITCRQLLYTPLEETFQHSSNGRAVAFFGTADPFINPDEFEKLLVKNDIPYSKYEGADHSLEYPDTRKSIETLSDVMRKAIHFMDA